MTPRSVPMARAVTPPGAQVARRMSPPMGYVALRWWWSRWHRFVRLGWSITRENPSGDPMRTYVGLGLIGFGLLLGSRRTKRLYRATVPSGEEIRIRVVPQTRSSVS